MSQRPARALRPALAVVGAVALAAVGGSASLAAAAPPGATSSATATPHLAGRYSDYVNPIIGTSGYVDTFPGPDVPFGMVQLGPDTSPDRPAGGGYEYTDKDLRGFSLSHVSGPGCGAGGDLPMLPVSGDVGSDPGSLVQPFSHTGEVAKAGFYQVTTGTGAAAVTSRMSTTTRAGISQFAFPSGADGHLVLKLTDSATPVDGTTGAVIGDREVIASVTTGHFCGQSPTVEDDYTIHVDLRFQQPFTASHVTGKSANGGPGTIVLDFPAGTTVTAKAGVSYTSDANAALNLATEIPGWNLAAVREAARSAWDAQLGKIEVGGGTKDQQVQFYTALYHALLHPNTFSDVNGQYPGFDGTVHTTDPGHVEYATFSGWDTYRSQAQLEAVVAPQQMSDTVRSMLHQYEQMGQLPKWAFNNGESYVMVGDPADGIIADAYAFGARDFDVQEALAAMVTEATQKNDVRPGQQVRDVKGYLPDDGSYGCCNFYGSASTLLEYDSADYAIASLARSLGNDSVYQRFATRSQDWQNIFNPATGYVQAKLADGTWAPGFTPGTSTGMVEGSASQYTPMVPHNLAALIAGKGGPVKYESFLDSLFTSIDHPGPLNADLSNEPSIEIPWEYDYVGAPWKTQQVVREAQQKLYFNAPVGSFGNDDLGAMSSWYVWSNLGMYPETPGTDTLVLGSPVFPTATVHLASGKALTVTAPRASTGTPYVQSLTLNGSAWDKPWVPGSRVLQGANLAFDLGSTPNKAWGSDLSKAPPSDPTGQQDAFVAASPSDVILQPGGTTKATVTVTNLAGRERTVRWTATAQSGVTVSPRSGSITVPAHGSASATATLTAAGDADGRYTVTFAFTSGRTVLPTSSVQVAVAPAGDIWPYYTNAGITDDAHTGAASFDGGGWSYSAQALAAAGVTPGSTVTADGVHYTWPDVPVATPDNIEESGQTIPLKVPAGASTIGLLGSASNAGSSGAGGTVTVHYTDGTSSTFDAFFSDWTLGGGGGTPVPGDTTAVTTAYRNSSGGRDPVKTYVFSVSAPLDAGKTVASITLPQAQGGDAHVFAIGFDTTGASSQAPSTPQHGVAAREVAPTPAHVVPTPTRR
ncbi:GH92 family glycosyl hydrolase [Lapillicoccus jejuensis]|uniref:Putative alpha-1,2-mannosidase n=1 Tax=Lapillicoccus jejuensis TaxID=402171 RepID=A0A542DYC5_9MICO|nr:GH92 family glycosyl hydrolase [Lapillicoccus jejuensis]TQJ08102.1 putative alpha-1,2-mannosidase [Lapillicoccus jejuensis]